MNDRVKRVEGYHQRHGNHQAWFSQRATQNKTLFEWIGILIIILAALAGFVPVLGLDDPSPVSLSEKITSFLAGLIIVLKGVERIWLPEEKWLNFRKASESLKIETELYIEGIAPYDESDDEESLYKLYVERCCLIKAEEQNNFWGLRKKVNGGSNSSNKVQMMKKNIE
jgi:hypothetical protein